MTLRQFPDVIQGTDDWHDLRRGIVTASVIDRLLTATVQVADNQTSRGLTATLVAERITGWTEDTYRSAEMWRGVEWEPIARDVYSRHYQQVDEAGFMLREEDGWKLGYSPDGVVGADGLIEIKTQLPKLHLTTILTDQVPACYVGQLQAGLLVSGRAWCDFVSFAGGMPLYVKRVWPDPAWHDAIAVAVAKFETTAVEMVAAYTHATKHMPATERPSLEIVI